jgi:hypothetical protein
MKFELGEKLQYLIDMNGCLAPSHRLIWQEDQINGGKFGYLELKSGLRYAKGTLIKGHRRPRRKRKSENEV